MHLQLVDRPDIELIVADLAQDNLARGDMDEADTNGGCDAPAFAYGADDVILRISDADRWCLSRSLTGAGTRAADGRCAGGRTSERTASSLGGIIRRRRGGEGVRPRLERPRRRISTSCRWCLIRCRERGPARTRSSRRARRRLEGVHDCTVNLVLNINDSNSNVLGKQLV